MGAVTISSATTVDEVIHGNPALVRVFAAHGVDTCCGGTATLAEAARTRGIRVEVLLQALTGADGLTRQAQPSAAPVGPIAATAACPESGGGGRPLNRTPAVGPANGARFARFFVGSLLFALTFGATLGLLLLASMTLPWNILRGVPVGAAKTAHAYAQVFGFATLFIMGVAYHTMPRFKSTVLATPRLSAASFWLQAGGVLLVGAGMLMGAPVSGLAWLIGALSLFAAALAFGWTAHRTLGATPPLAEGVEPYLRAGCVWLVVATGLAVSAASGMGATVHPAMWAAALWGFIGSWIFGMSLRVLPVFMGLPPARRRHRVFAFYQAGVLLWVSNALIEAWTIVPVLRAIAGAALGVSAVVFVLRLGIFGPRDDAGHGVDRGYEKFIVTAYVWLVAALVFEPGWSMGAVIAGTPAPSLLLDFGRHAFTLGFLTQLIIGVASRIVPVFTGNRLWSPRWREATYYLLNAAVAMRALQAVVEIGGIEVLWPYVSLSGPLGLAAFVAFSANVLMTMGARRRSLAAGADTTTQEPQPAYAVAAGGR